MLQLGYWWWKEQKHYGSNVLAHDLIFCLSADGLVEAGFYAVAVAADLIQGPINLPHEQTRVGGASCQDGYVGPNGYPIYTSPSALGALPQCNPSGASNELRPNRPYYRLSVHHKMYTDEPLSRNELRPACTLQIQHRQTAASLTST